MGNTSGTHAAPRTAPRTAKIELKSFPNPFNPTTTIAFRLPEASILTVKVFNILGQEVATLAQNQRFSAGAHSLTFNAFSNASGMYFCRVVSQDGKYSQVAKLLLIK